MENKETEPQNGNNESRVETMAATLDKFSADLETVKADVEKRKSENTTLKILFYTALVVLLGGFLYSNSVLQRAHMRSLERNILSLEQRLGRELNGVKTEMKNDLQGLHDQVQAIYGADLLTILARMDETVTQMDPKDERTAMLINRVRLHADELSRAIKDHLNRSRPSPGSEKTP